MTLVVILTVRKDAAELFRAFETKAAAVMTKYGGAMERVIVVAGDGSQSVFREVHIVTFPRRTAWEAYQADTEMQAVMHLRTASVVATDVLIGEDVTSYSAAR